MGAEHGKPNVSLSEMLERRRDEQPVTQRCLFCAWTWIGLAGEGREAARSHREERHPEAVARRVPRRRKSLTRPEQKLTEREYDELKRARQERDEAERLAKVLRGQARDAVADGEAA